MQPMCFDCRFLYTLEGETANDLTRTNLDDCIQGECRIHPPQVGRFRGEVRGLPYDYGQWPLVMSGDWCGAFQPCERALRDNAATSAHVGPGATIPIEAEQPAKDAVGA